MKVQNNVRALFLAGERRWYVNVTITVKMDYQELHSQDRGLLNHTRLLHSVVTGAVDSPALSVHHVHSYSPSPFLTASQLLVGAGRPISVRDLAALLQLIVQRVEEVSAVDVRDVDECAHEELYSCPPAANCLNTEGSYNCSCHEGFTDSSPNGTVTGCLGPSHSADPTEETTPSFTSSTMMSWTHNYSSDASATDTLLQNSTASETHYNSSTDPPSPATSQQKGDWATVLLVTSRPVLPTQSPWTNLTTVSESRSSSTVSLWNVTETPDRPSPFTASSPSGGISPTSTAAGGGSGKSAEALLTTSTQADSVKSTISPGASSVVIHSTSLTEPPWSTTTPQASYHLQHPTTASYPSTTAPLTMESQTALARNCHPALIKNLVVLNVTGSSFYMRWSVDSPVGRQAYVVQLLRGTQSVDRAETELLSWEATGLEPGVLYTVRVTSRACGQEGNATSQDVKTEGKALRGRSRLTNVQFTEALRNSSSGEYLNLTRDIWMEICKSLPPDVRALVELRAVSIVITRLSSGSVMVDFLVLFSPGLAQNMTAVSTAILDSLKNSTRYDVDRNSTGLEDFDECAAGDEDCSPHAVCENTWGSFRCACRSAFTDTNPARPGRSCEDVNECESGSNTCSPHAVCQNTVGGYSCSCQPGFNDTDPSQPGRHCADVNECESGNNMCHQSAACQNTVGGYICACRPGFADADPSQPGRLCAAVATEKTVTSSISISETSKTPTAVAPPLLHTNPTSWALVDVDNAITVDCRLYEISVTVSKAFLTWKSIAESSLFLGVTECGLSSTNETHVKLTAMWDNCDTKLVHNRTHTTAWTTLLNNRTVDSSIAPRVYIEIPVKCTYSNSLLISTGYTPTGVDMIKDIIEGSGIFLATIQLLNGTSPLPKNYSLSPDDEVFIEVGINLTMTQVKLILNECWATPTSSPSDPTTHMFMKNSCPIPNTYTTVIENGNSTKARLSLRIFSFVDHSVIYLHCQVQICIETAGTSCKPHCEQRSERSIKAVEIGQASWGPIYRSSHAVTKETPNSQRETGFIVLGVLLCLLLLVTLTVVALFYRKRIGHYNFSFKPNQENFTYHVFDT
nr:PREDICTED: uromodulin-like 1 isoform X1 [Lepisosteus oculatus]